MGVLAQVLSQAIAIWPFPLPTFTRPQAVTRLKANLFGLFIAFGIRYTFSPYIVLRRGLLELGTVTGNLVWLLGMFMPLWR
jgi:hypothetical protein